jgi:hypothetical protein
MVKWSVGFDGMASGTGKWVANGESRPATTSLAH